jgi:superfamily II DNA or RNA helicase
MIKTLQHRPYQQRIREKLNANWGKGVNSQLVVAPTGAGKSVLGIQALADIKANSQELFGCAPEEVGFGWVAHRRNLLTMVEKTNAEMFQVPDLHTISMFDADPKQLLAKYKVRVLCHDECQHNACSTAVGLHSAINPHLSIGLSATPLRTDRMDLCFQVTVQDAGYHRLIQEGWLSQFDHYSISGRWTPQSVAETYLAEPKRWGQSVIFFLTRKECEDCAAILRTAGIRAEVVTGSSNREQQQQDFEDGKVDVMISMAVLTEGFDCPQLQTVWVRDSKHRSVITQMSGRALRLFEVDGVRIAKNVVQSIEAGYPFTRVASARMQYLQVDGKWRSIGANDKAWHAYALVSGRRVEAYARGDIKPNAYMLTYSRGVEWDSTNGVIKKPAVRLKPSSDSRNEDLAAQRERAQEQGNADPGAE